MSDIAADTVTAIVDTLLGPAGHAMEVRHSRFVAHAMPLSDADDATAALAGSRVAMATHNCWAWRFGEAYRSSDDGEPAGTAGRPILAAIDGQCVDHVMVVVTRWFGGIELGAGGLVRAYGNAAAECLRGARRTPLVHYSRLDLQAGFDDLGHVHAAIAAFDAKKLEQTFDPGGAGMSLRVASSQVADLKTWLRDATRDRVTIVAGD